MPTDRGRADRPRRPTAAVATDRGDRSLPCRAAAATDRRLADRPRRPTATAPTDRADRRGADQPTHKKHTTNNKQSKYTTNKLCMRTVCDTYTLGSYLQLKGAR